MSTMFLRFVNKYISYLVWISIHLLIVELVIGKENSLDSSMIWFLWIERITAFVFMTEYFIRWYEDHENPDGNLDLGHSYYPLSIMGIIDLISWLPWLIGFFVAPQYLAIIRVLRILRALKLFRYNRSLQLIALAIYKRRNAFKSIFLIIYIVGLFSICSLYIIERGHNEDFNNIFNVAWFYVVTLTTVGYGDMSPITPLGKIVCAIIVFFPAIGMAGALFGVLGNAWDEITELEKSEVDPILEFMKEKGK